MTRTRVAALAVICALGAGTPALAADEGAWADIRASLYGERPIQDGAGVIALDAPERAHDAALVPVTIEALIPQSDRRRIESVTLIIDDNPAPVAGTFHFWEQSGTATLSTRVRINSYTNVRAIAETTDGELYMAERFVKASGGCSAPALKDHEQAMARLGQMKLKHTPFRLGEPNQVQLLISHPNYTGMQMDQLSRHWIPPHYVERIEVTYGGEPVLEVAGDISLSENPSIHFSFVPEAPGELAVMASDNEGGRFTRTWQVPADAGS